MNESSANIDDETTMYVKTRTGRMEPLDTNQITRRFQTLINRSPKIAHINAHALMLEVCRGLKSGISTYEIDEYAADAAASLSVSNPYYLKIAARIAIDNHQKNTMRSFVDKMRSAYLNVDTNGNINSLINSTFYKYVEEHQDAIESMIDYSRDFLLDFFGFRTFQKSFSLKVKGTPIERPQDMFMRTAIALHLDYVNGTNVDGVPVSTSVRVDGVSVDGVNGNTNVSTSLITSVDDVSVDGVNGNTSVNTGVDIINALSTQLAAIKETYNLLSNKLYTQASPTYYNAGGHRPQYASCFLLGSEDSCEGIMKTAVDISKISKLAGGIGIHGNCWRAAGALIRGTNGQTSGIIHWLKIFQETLRGFNQGGRRPGRAAIYMMPHHPDFMKFIEIVRNDGTEETRARDLFTAVWLPDIFMERVKSGAMWSFFDPDVCGDLSNYTGADYTAQYLKLEEAKKYTHQINARKVWETIYETNRQVGHPYICFSDVANKLTMQKNLGIIKSSNLCSEVYLYSDEKEYGVCILSSIGLPNYVFDGYSKEELEMPESTRRELNHEYPVNPYFDFKKLISVVKTITTNLNLIVDKTYHPVEETKRSNARHRPIGIGVQGLDDAYAKMRFAFASDEAYDLNKKIFETIYYAAISQSSQLARQQYLTIRKQIRDTGAATVVVHDEHTYTTKTVTYTNILSVPKNIGAYPSMLWNGGSPISKGVFHWELSGLSTDSLSGMFDWETLREHVKEFGVVNSLTTAVMPTASTSQLLGNNECIEPYTSNIYKRSTLAGEYIVIKKYLMNDLYKLGIWSANIKDYLIASDGSIQHIDGIPTELKKLYPTVWEIDQIHLVKQAIDRQPFIDQGQSLNLYVQNISMAKWNELMFTAWKGGLPTGKYYLHSRAAATPQKFTIDPAKQAEMAKLLEKNKHGTAHTVKLHDICDSCSG